MVLFDDRSYVHFLLDTWLTNDDVANAIMSAVYTGGGTDIADAMNTAITQVSMNFFSANFFLHSK
jgi:hypothetical protein